MPSFLSENRKQPNILAVGQRIWHTVAVFVTERIYPNYTDMDCFIDQLRI